MKSLIRLICLALVATAGQVQAGVINYTITVEVTAAGLLPGTFEPWSFTSVPSTFVGTFQADDSLVGEITNLELIIGGIDIAASHPLIALNSFDPSTLLLSWGAVNTSDTSVVLLGSVTPNYAVAFEDNDIPPLDPFLGLTQNWVGTYSITPTTVIPEPSSIGIWGIGVLGIGLVVRRRKIPV